jgi:hypothetical protein
MIDTRDKIVSLEDVEQMCENCPVVAAYCDPLLPEVVHHWKALGSNVILVIVPPPDAYLDPRARAELGASLSFVRAVAIAGEDFEHPVEEAEARERFIAYVRERARQS